MDTETFSIIKSALRIGLGTNSIPFRRQAERLQKVFQSNGLVDESMEIDGILKAEAKTATLQPSRVILSRATTSRERISQKTSPPVDRETASPLAEIFMPEDIEEGFPILRKELSSAINDLIEEWKSSSKLVSHGLRPATTCLIYGLPGTGKTRMAMQIARELGLPVVLARLDGLISSFLGTTGRNVANLFSFANRYECILLLDEFDAVAKVRDDPHELGEIKRVVNAILQNIDTRREIGVTIAITNHEQLLDSAVWRRFDVRLFIPPPSFEERVSIINCYFSDIGTSEETVKFLAWLTEGLTGSDIEVMATNIKRHRILRPTVDLLGALKYYSITQAGRSVYRYMELLEKSSSQMAVMMNEARDLQLSQKQIGMLLSVSQSQVARWIKENSKLTDHAK